jgi:uncharacterized peroxidase-related enzyme
MEEMTCIVPIVRYIAPLTIFLESLLSRIQPIDPSHATGAAAEQLAAARKMFGGTPNLVTTAAHSPAALGAMLSLFSTIGKTSLGAATGEQIAIAFAMANGCGYCLAAHTALGANYNLSPAALAEARQGRATDARTTALMSLAIAINDARGQVDDATLRRARAAGITDGEIVEVVAHVALNAFTNYLNNVAETPIDFPEVPLLAVA